MPLELDLARGGVITAPTRRVFGGDVPGATLPSYFTAGANGTYTVLSGAAGLGGVDIATGTPAGSNLVSDIVLPAVDVQNAQQVRVRAVFDIERATQCTIHLTNSGGVVIGRTSGTASANKMYAYAGSGATNRYVTMLMSQFVDGNNAWTSMKRIDAGFILDVPSKSLYFMEGDECVDMWENITGSYLAVNTAMVPRFRIVAESGQPAAHAILRSLTAELFYR